MKPHPAYVLRLRLHYTEATDLQLHHGFLSTLGKTRHTTTGSIAPASSFALRARRRPRHERHKLRHSVGPSLRLGPHKLARDQGPGTVRLHQRRLAHRPKILTNYPSKFSSRRYHPGKIQCSQRFRQRRDRNWIQKQRSRLWMDKRHLPADAHPPDPPTKAQ